MSSRVAVSWSELVCKWYHRILRQCSSLSWDFTHARFHAFSEHVSWSGHVSQIHVGTFELVMVAPSRCLAWDLLYTTSWEVTSG